MGNNKANFSKESLHNYKWVQVAAILGLVTSLLSIVTAEEVSGEQDEAELNAEVDFASNDAAYLSQLGLIRGHLAVGYALYKRDLPDLSATHMKHPKEEIYLRIEPAFASRGCNGFATELTELTALVIERAPIEEITVTYIKLTGAIHSCETTVDINDPKLIAKVIETLLRTAAEEYQVGVIDGVLNNLHEYQDAWGFTQIANNWAISEVFVGNLSVSTVGNDLQLLIANLENLWPSLNPDDVSGLNAEQLFVAARQVDAIALALQH